MDSEPRAQLTTCPNCGHTFDPVSQPRMPKPLRRKHYMVWSDRMDSYVRKELTEAEWQRYDQKGSID